MENSLETEITAFRHDLQKMEASVRQLIMVANNQLKKVSQTIFLDLETNYIFARTKIWGKKKWRILDRHFVKWDLQSRRNDLYLWRLEWTMTFPADCGILMSMRSGNLFLIYFSNTEHFSQAGIVFLVRSKKTIKFSSRGKNSYHFYFPTIPHPP